MLKTALTNKSIEKGRALEAAEELQVVSMLVKQRRDSIDQFTKGGRQDLADKEQAEIVILNTYLPAAASDEEIAAAVAAAITETAQPAPKDMGKVMKAAMAGSREDRGRQEGQRRREGETGLSVGHDACSRTVTERAVKQFGGTPLYTLRGLVSLSNPLEGSEQMVGRPHVSPKPCD